MLLVSNNPNSNSINFAKEAGIDTFIINKRRYPINDEYDKALKEKLLSVKPDLIVLAGYMKLIPKSITSLFENKMNNHLCLNCIFPNKNDINLPRCETVGVSGIATGMAGLIAAQKTINFLISLNNESNILTLLNVIKGDFHNIFLKTNNRCYLKK